MLVGKRTRGSSLLIVLTTVGVQELALSAAIAVFFLGKKARNSGALEVKPVAENHLGKQMIRCARHAHSHSKIDFPFGREIQVNRRKNLLLLLADGVEARHRTQRAVVLNSSGNFLGEIVAEFEIRREHQPLTYARAMKGPVERGIEGQIPLAELLIRDRPNFPRPRVCGIPAALPANFVREADPNGPMPLGRNAHAGPDVAANVIPTLAVLGGSKNVKPGFEPVIEAVCDLDGFVQLIARRKSPIISCFGALKRAIRMQ